MKNLFDIMILPHVGVEFDLKKAPIKPMNYNWLGGIKWFYQAFAEFISTPMVCGSIGKDNIVWFVWRSGWKPREALKQLMNVVAHGCGVAQWDIPTS